MITIKELVNKIRWDKRETPSDYTVGYEDRVLKKVIEVPYTAIKRIEGGFFIIEKEGRETDIPLHRVKRLKKQGKTVWKR